jgi:competence protein ComEC
MHRKIPDPQPFCTAVPVFFVFLVVAAALAAGCLDHGTVPDINSFLSQRSHESGGDLRAYFLDVGQGDSTLILFKNTTILIDTGEQDRGDVVVRDLQLLGIDRIDLLVATHPHSDHIGGMETVLAAFPIGRVADAGMPHPSPLYARFLDAVEARHIPYTVVHEGDTVDLNPALRILVLSPPEQQSGDDINDDSVVLRISYGTFDILLTGDAGFAAENRIIATGYALDAEILKVAHHGSAHATGSRFLKRVHPAVAVIPVGAANPYGHPADATLAALEQAGCTVYRTDRDGDIMVRSDGISYTVQTSRGTGHGLFLPVTTGGAPFSTTTATSPTPAPYDVVISETRFNAPGDDRTNLNGEYIRITNRGGGVVNLNGWTLSDRTGSRLYLFPAFLLLPESSVSVFTGTGAINDTALFMGRTSPVWSNSGDDAVLQDERGNTVDRRSEGDGS